VGIAVGGGVLLLLALAVCHWRRSQQRRKQRLAQAAPSAPETAPSVPASQSARVEMATPYVYSPEHAQALRATQQAQPWQPPPQPVAVAPVQPVVLSPADAFFGSDADRLALLSSSAMHSPLAMIRMKKEMRAAMQAQAMQPQHQAAQTQMRFAAAAPSPVLDPATVALAATLPLPMAQQQMSPSPPQHQQHPEGAASPSGHLHAAAAPWEGDRPSDSASARFHGQADGVAPVNLFCTACGRLCSGGPFCPGCGRRQAL